MRVIYGRASSITDPTSNNRLPAFQLGQNTLPPHIVQLCRQPATRRLPRASFGTTGKRLHHHVPVGFRALTSAKFGLSHRTNIVALDHRTLTFITSSSNRIFSSDVQVEPPVDQGLQAISEGKSIWRHVSYVSVVRYIWLLWLTYSTWFCCSWLTRCYPNREMPAAGQTCPCKDILPRSSATIPSQIV